MEIEVVYSAIDGARKAQTFDDLIEARQFATYWVGEHPEFGRSYAVSGDGVGKIEVWGVTLQELFGCK